jgi:hypothetical protein
LVAIQVFFIPVKVKNTKEGSIAGYDSLGQVDLIIEKVFWLNTP